MPFFYVGYVEDAKTYVLYNHVNIIIEYHEVDENAYRYDDGSALFCFCMYRQLV